MPHYPKPFFRKSRQLWYVQIDGRQINLGPDRDAAFTQYRDLMATPKLLAPAIRNSAGELVVVLCDRFLDWVQLHRSAGTYQWYWWRLQSFAKRYPDLTIDELETVPCSRVGRRPEHRHNDAAELHPGHQAKHQMVPPPGLHRR